MGSRVIEEEEVLVEVEVNSSLGTPKLSQMADEATQVEEDSSRAMDPLCKCSVSYRPLFDEFRS